MAETPQVGLTADQLQSVLQTVIAAIKEPSEADKLKLAKQREQDIRSAKEQAELAKIQEENKSRRWNGCPHFEMYNGRRFNKWGGQVNSDGMVKPVCNICHVEAPMFSAKLLPDEGKQGVNFEQWNDASKEMLVKLHKQTFPNGCGSARCFVCLKAA